MHTCDPSTPTGRWETETGQSPGVHRPASLAYSVSPSKWKEETNIWGCLPTFTSTSWHAYTYVHTQILSHTYRTFTNVMYTHMQSYTHIHPKHTSMLKVLYKIPYLHNVAYETYLHGAWVSSSRYLMSIQILQILGEIFWDLKNYLSIQWHLSCILRTQQSMV